MNERIGGFTPWSGATPTLTRDDTGIEPEAGAAPTEPAGDGRGSHGPMLVAMVVVAGAVAWTLLLFAATTSGFSDPGGLLLLPVVVAACIPVMRLAMKGEDLWVRHAIIIAFVAKMVGTAARYIVTLDVYDSADARAYIVAGARLVPIMRSGLWRPTSELTGTRFIEALTGGIFAVTGPSPVLGFAIYSMLAFTGLCLFFRAFRLALPTGDHHRYLLLLFFLPTMLFWPASVGKESWMVFVLGISTYGVARVFRYRPGGYLLTALGLLGAVTVRPHMAALVGAGLMVGMTLRRRDSAKSSPFGWMNWVVGVVVIGVAGALLLTKTEEFFGVGLEPTNPHTREATGGDEFSVGDLFLETDRRSSTGNSAFDNRPVDSPFALPEATLTVLFRPFPTEAHNAQSLIASMEGLLLLGLGLLSVRRVLRAPKIALRRPLVAFAIVYTLLFVVGFSNIGNFGILVRQRTQLYPVLAILVCLPVATDREGSQPPAAPARATL